MQLILPLLLLILDKIEVHTSDPSVFIFCVIPHIPTAFRKLTGFCNGSGCAGYSIQIKRDTAGLIELQLLLERFLGFLFLRP